MKILFNLSAIILIGLLSSTYMFNFSPIDYAGTIEIKETIKTNNIVLSVDESDKIVNPQSIVIKHLSDDEVTMTNPTGYIFSANVYKGNDLVKENITDLEISPILSSNSSFILNAEKPMISTLDISQQKLGLEDGSYKIVFQSGLITNPNHSSIAVDVVYQTDGSYYAATNNIPVGTIGLTLYFPTKNADTVIPVTRYIKENKSITKHAIEELQKGPQNKDLTTAVGDVNYISYKSGNVFIDLPSSYTAYNSGSAGGSMAYESMLKSICAVERYWRIHSIRFTVDDAKADDFFHGISIADSIKNTADNYLLYMSYTLDGRCYLFETQASGIEPTDTAEVAATKIFAQYNQNELKYGNSPVPNNIKLNSAVLQNGILALDFDDNFLSAYPERDDLKIRMIDSMAYSFASIPNVNGIKITTNNKPLVGFVKNIDFTGNITPAKFINPESVK